MHTQAKLSRIWRNCLNSRRKLTQRGYLDVFLIVVVVRFVFFVCIASVAIVSDAWICVNQLVEK